MTLTTGLGQQSTKMTRCWDKMCFLQVWLMCSGFMSPHTAETLPNTLLCLKGSCDSEENHPAPEHLGKFSWPLGFARPSPSAFCSAATAKSHLPAPQGIWGPSQRALGTRLLLKARGAQVSTELLLHLGWEGSLELSNPACSKQD